MKGEEGDLEAWPELLEMESEAESAHMSEMEEKHDVNTHRAARERREGPVNRYIHLYVSYFFRISDAQPFPTPTKTGEKRTPKKDRSTGR